jgi:hypothetical protein
MRRRHVCRSALRRSPGHPCPVTHAQTTVCRRGTPRGEVRGLRRRGPPARCTRRPRLCLRRRRHLTNAGGLPGRGGATGPANRWALPQFCSPAARRIPRAILRDGAVTACAASSRRLSPARLCILCHPFPAPSAAPRFVTAALAPPGFGSCALPRPPAATTRASAPDRSLPVRFRRREPHSERGGSPRGADEAVTKEADDGRPGRQAVQYHDARRAARLALEAQRGERAADPGRAPVDAHGRRGSPCPPHQPDHGVQARCPSRSDGRTERPPQRPAREPPDDPPRGPRRDRRVAPAAG